MDASLKQRLVGAVVLVALAVIFLPMLLDGSGARGPSNQDIRIPDQPEPPESQLDGATGGAGAGSANGAGATSTRNATPEGEEGERAADAGADAGTADTPDPDAGSTTASATGPNDESGAGGADAPPDEAGTASDAPASGWIVQVGSFRRETNALVLRDRLRESGFDSQAERVRSDGRTLWRVLVGPVAERGDGEALQRRIEARREGDTLLLSYP